MKSYNEIDHLIAILSDSVVRKIYHTSHSDTFEFMSAMCSHFIRNPDPLVVPVYSFQDLGSDKRRHYYHYDMMRCVETSPMEAEIVDLVSDALYRRSSNPIHSFHASENVDPYVAREQFPKLFSFLEAVIEQDRYHDLHGDNVMINTSGNYCLIDLEGFTYPPLNKSNNSWITKG